MIEFVFICSVVAVAVVINYVLYRILFNVMNNEDNPK